MSRKSKELDTAIREIFEAHPDLKEKTGQALLEKTLLVAFEFGVESARLARHVYLFGKPKKKIKLN
jgi:hypothetical protein